MDDLAIIVVSTNEAHWLTPCLTTVLEHTGEADVDVVVADNESTDGTRELIEREFPSVRVVTCPNRGFAHANNRGLMTTESRYVLFLNPDTEILEGTFEELVRAMDERPSVGLIGVNQLLPDDSRMFTIRRFPGALRALAEALWPERLPFSGRLGERELRPAAYEKETVCDWVSGSFMLVRREALDAAGCMDERFFIFSEEPDLSLRIKKAGWETRHLPLMTILHHADKIGISPKMVAQDTFSRVQYAGKHFSKGRRVAYRGAITLRWLLRFVVPSGDSQVRVLRRTAARRAMRVALGFEHSPFGEPPEVAVAARQVAATTAEHAGQRRGND